MKNLSLKERLHSHWASAGAAVFSLLGVICFAILTASSFESTETPAAVIGLGIAVILCSGLCFLNKDFFHAVSVVGFLASLGCMGAFTAGRVSYLAFYLSGDVLNTGLSPFFFLSAICFLLSVVFAALAMAQPFDGKNWGEAVKNLIVAIAAIAIIAVVAFAVVNAIMAPTAAPVDPKPPVSSDAPETTEAPSLYKNPTKDASHWQGYTPEQLAAEDVSGKAIAYQFSGSTVTNEREVNILINLYEDGFVRIFQHTADSLTFEYNGYWRVKDGESLYFGTSNYVYRGAPVPSQGMEPGAIASVDYSYDMVMENDKFSFGCNFCMGFADGGQFVRSQIIEGTGEVKFAAREDYVASLAGSAPAETTEATTGDDTPEYPANTMLLTFIPDTSEQLKTTFSCESSVWGPALGMSGAYTPTDAADELFVWHNNAESYILTFFANGTYEYQFTTMGIKETGTWAFEGWTLTATTAKGKTATAEITKAAEEAPAETTEATTGDDTPEYPANTMLLTFIPDTSDQLKTTFSCESSVWGPALGMTGAYTPTDAADVLFVWHNNAESYILTFFTNGTYEYQFTTMGIKETGTWAFEGWKLTTTTANGKTATGEITK